MGVEILIGSRTDVGRVRSNNEDSCSTIPEIKLFIVSDGMGGQSHGEVASAIAVDTIAEYCTVPRGDISSSGPDRRPDLSEKTNRLISAVRCANNRIYRTGSENPLLRGMGATVVAAWLEDLRLSLVHVGDSRAYLLRAGALAQLTVDHTLLAEQIRTGLIKSEEAHLSNFQSVLIRALGTHENVELDATEYMLANNDIMLLCTDGLTRMVSDPEIASTLMEYRDAQTTADKLIAMANDHGGRDNISVIVLHINSLPPSEL
jgi:serine/threonine protein phosphatase PrpC